MGKLRPKEDKLCVVTLSIKGKCGSIDSWLVLPWGSTDHYTHLWVVFPLRFPLSSLVEIFVPSSSKAISLVTAEDCPNRPFPYCYEPQVLFHTL